jgi:rubrerythrin
MKHCEFYTSSKAKFCFACGEYPCKKVKHIDKRYRSKYGMSMIENLNAIKETGIRNFIKLEKQKWTCPECGNLICVHKKNCLICSAEHKNFEMQKNIDNTN